MMKVLSDRIGRLCPSATDQTRKKITEWIEGGQFSNLKLPISKYAQLIRPHMEELGCLGAQGEDLDPLGAGLFCWVGQLVFFAGRYGSWDLPSESYPQGVIHGDLLLEACFDFSLLYISFDYFLDRVGYSDHKLHTLELIRRQIVEPELQLRISGFSGAIEAYKRLVRLRPSLQPQILEIFECEIASHKFQKSASLNLRDHLEMACDKGGLTCLAILTLITGRSYSTSQFRAPIPTGERWSSRRPDNSDSGAYSLGAIVQIIDDIMDVREDLRDSISTVATSTLKERGTLDWLWIECFSMVENLPTEYQLFKPLTAQLLCYTTRQKGLFSSRLKIKVQESLLLQKDCKVQVLGLINRMILQEVDKIENTAKEAPPSPLEE